MHIGRQSTHHTQLQSAQQCRLGTATGFDRHIDQAPLHGRPPGAWHKRVARNRLMRPTLAEAGPAAPVAGRQWGSTTSIQLAAPGARPARASGGSTHSRRLGIVWTLGFDAALLSLLANGFQTSCLCQPSTQPSARPLGPAGLAALPQEAALDRAAVEGERRRAAGLPNQHNVSFPHGDPCRGVQGLGEGSGARMGQGRSRPPGWPGRGGAAGGQRDRALVAAGGGSSAEQRHEGR